MRVLVCGGRDFDLDDVVLTTLDRLDAKSFIGVVIHGGASGADALANAWAKKRDVQTIVYPADWRKSGKAAGPLRNERMLRESRPDIVVAFPGGKGTTDMVRRAMAAGTSVVQVSREGVVRGAASRLFAPLRGDRSGSAKR